MGGLMFDDSNVDASDGRMDAAWAFWCLGCGERFFFWICHDWALFGMRHESKSF
jgi:hypothetical protein